MSGLPPILIVGAGLTGLSAALHLERAGVHDWALLEAGTEVGGLARTATFDGFSFDHAIHILYSKDPYATALIRDDLLAGGLRVQERRSYCHTEGIYTEYPYQLNTFGLPPEVVSDNILGLLDALGQTGTPPHFAAWITRSFGRGVAERFMLPYNRKVWAWKLEEMGFDWIADRVPRPDLREVLMGALRPPAHRTGPNSEFWYPERGGIATLPQAMAARLPPKLRFGQRVVAVDAAGHTVQLADGAVLPYRALITTAPLSTLTAMVTDAPRQVRVAGQGLVHNRVHTVSIGLKGEALALPFPMHWAYYPDEDILFHRLCFPHQFSSWMVPAGCASIQAEISESPHRSLHRRDLVRETLVDLVRVGVLRAEEARPVAEGGRVRVAEVLTLEPAYILYTLAHRAQQAAVQTWLQANDIHSCGRFGDWEYLNMDQSILQGRDAAAAVR